MHWRPIGPQREIPADAGISPDVFSRASCSENVCFFRLFHVKLYLQKKPILPVSVMHETSLIQEMLEVVARVRRENGERAVASLNVEISEFGGWDPEHFREHFARAVAGTVLQDVRLNILRVRMGPEARLAQVTFQP